MSGSTITLTRYGRNGEEEEDLSRARAEQILETVNTMWEGVINALLVIEGSDESALYVNATDGRYIITARLGYDAFLELIGADLREGEVPYVTGGQSMRIPARQLTSAAVAVAVVRHFLSTGNIDRGSNVWEVR